MDLLLIILTILGFIFSAIGAASTIKYLLDELSMGKKLSWRAVRGDIMKLAEHVKHSFEPNHIVAVSAESTAGGMVVGDLLAAYLKIPITIIMFNEERSDYELAHANNRNIKDDSHILIVDDITFSGSTFLKTKDLLQKQFPEARIRCGVLVVYESELSEREQELKPDYFVRKTPNLDRYKMPWGVMEPTKKSSKKG